MYMCVEVVCSRMCGVMVLWEYNFELVEGIPRKQPATT